MEKSKGEFVDFTVVIPEHNRPNRLRRLLEYFISFDIRVVVTDSSDKEFKYLAEFKDKITYRFYPRVDLAKKLANIVSLIKTPYVVMCANDDFLVPEAINDIITFLKSDKNYNSGQGIYTDFTPNKGNLLTSLRYRNAMDINLNDVKGAERLLKLQSNYFQYYYAVFRTEVFSRTIFSIIDSGEAQIKNLCLLESYMSCYAAINGKHIILPIFYAARENIINSAGSNTPSIPLVLCDKKSKKEIDIYLYKLAVLLAETDKISLQNAIYIVNQALMAYVSNLQPDFYSFKGKIKRKLKSLFKSKLTIKLLDYLRKDNNKNINLPVPHNLNGWDQWSRIEKQIKKHYYIYNT